MRGKLLNIVFCTAMVATMATGCAHKAVNGDNGTMDGNSVADSDNSDATEDIHNMKPEKTEETISLTLWGTEEDKEFLEKVVESFKEDNPGQKFEITIRFEAESTCKAAVLRNIEEAADVYAFADDQLEELVNAGALEPVPSAESIASQNSQGSVEAATVDGTLYAYPYSADNGYFMFYNKKYFSEEDVKTFDRMLKIAEREGKKIAMDWSSAWYVYAFFGGAGLEAELSEDGKTTVCNWNSKNTDIKGVDVARAMLDISASKGFCSMTDPQIQTGFEDGSVIAAVEGTWAAMKAEEAWGDNYAAVKLPTYTCAESQIQMASFAGYKLVGVNAYSKNIRWAMELAKWLTNEQNQVLHFKERGIGPSNVVAASYDYVNASPAISALIAQSDYASLLRVGANFWDNVAEFGVTMAEGNPKGTDLQKMLDKMVNAVTAPAA